jgi:hydroxypyruvate reductase
MQDVRAFLEDLFNTAVAAAQPELVLPQYLPPVPKGRTLVIGAGKAAAAMARVVDECWRGELSGLVVTRRGQAQNCGRIDLLEAAHPVPDASGEEAARLILDACRDLCADDLVLCLLSGGGSALLSLPGEGISLEDKRALNSALLSCGAGIGEINTVRKHVSAIKGGRLAVACHPARVVTLVISDVPGDDPQLIASGPTVPDTTTAADALAVIERYQLNVPASVRHFLDTEAAETPDASDPAFSGNELHIIATAQLSLEAAVRRAGQSGVSAMVLSDSVEGESRKVANDLAQLARQVKHSGKPMPPPCVILSGGETTVTVGGDGKGGPNTELGLAMAISLDGEQGITALSCDTDGIDGSEDNAGCFIDDHTLARARELGLNPSIYLENNDAWSFFEPLGDLIVTGPTDTNVNDFRAMYIAGDESSD